MLLCFFSPPYPLPKMFVSSFWAGWKELKKSSPPKSISSFFALSDLTAPLSYLRAKVIPPPLEVWTYCKLLIFFPNCMAFLAGAAVGTLTLYIYACYIGLGSISVYVLIVGVIPMSKGLA